jgi:tetratricopeptide (TPR) repeat protein/predicted Ser/Thr protein kinase
MNSSDDTVPRPHAEVDVVGATQHRAHADAALHDLQHLLERGPDVGRLSHYALLGRLGQGGMGIVYAAFDEKLERKVAIKLLRSPDSKDAKLRLVREAQAMARLSHPNVVQIYEISEFGDTVFIVMEFVKGVTLREWLTQARRTQAEILEVFGAAGKGLVAAHERGLVHRDFKPDNVMIRSDGRVLVMDFGLAHGSTEQLSRIHSRIRPAGRLAVDLTATGQLVGTPAYMAPEQFNGAETGPHTDQFSFCVALWEALEGTRPFSGASFEQLALAVTTGRHAKYDDTKIPSWLRRIIMRGLEIDPALRWPSLQDLLDGLAADPTRRRRGLAIALGGFVLVLGGVIALWAVHAHRRAEAVEACEMAGRTLVESWNEARPELARAFESTKLEFAVESWQHAELWLDTYVQAWADARTRVCVETTIEQAHDDQYHALATACLDERAAIVTGLFEAWTAPDSSIVARAPLAASELPGIDACTRPADLFSSPLSAPEPLTFEVEGLRRRLDRAAALRHAGRYDDGLIAAKAVLGEATELGWVPVEAEAWLAVGQLQEDLGQYRDARDSVQRAYLEAIESGDDSVAFEASASLAWIVGSKLGDENGLLWGEIAAALVRRQGLEGSLQEATLLNNVAAVLRGQGKRRDSLEKHRRALAIREQLVGPQHPYVASSLNNIGVVLWSLGEYDEALAAHRRELEISRAAFGNNHLMTASAHAGIGNVMFSLGNLDEALVAHRESLAIKQRVLGPDHPNCARSHNNMGVILTRRGSYTAAEQEFLRALQIWEKQLGPDDVKVANSLAGLGRARHGLGHSVAARADLERALAIFVARQSSLADLAETHFALALVLWDAGEHERALELGRQALEGYEQQEMGAEADLREVQAWLRERDIPSAPPP